MSEGKEIDYRYLINLDYKKYFKQLMKAYSEESKN